MKRSSKIITAALVLLTTVGVVAQGPLPVAPQSKESQPGVAVKPPAPAPVSLKVSLVFSRYQGEKKISSAPHTLWVTANDPGRTSLRLGTQIPVASTIFGKEGEKTESYNYRDVGTNIDCSASTSLDGAFKLSITITDSAVYYPDQPDSPVRPSTLKSGAPAFRNFNSSFVLLLKDGQTAQSASVTDPASGQVIKLDATLNVQK